MLYVNNLRAYNFRNFSEMSAEFGQGVNIIHGGNAQGKTNLLEAVFFLRNEPLRTRSHGTGTCKF
jgi:DNA replication and repair protein RecF